MAPVTRTEIFFPLSPPTSLYLALVAFLIGLPLRSHWSLTLTPAGPQVPGFAASVEPTRAFPLIDGFPGTSRPAATAAVGALTTVLGTEPARVPVTWTARAAPRSVADGV